MLNELEAQTLCILFCKSAVNTDYVSRVAVHNTDCPELLQTRTVSPFL